MSDMTNIVDAPDLRIRIAVPEDMEEMLKLAWLASKENSFITPSLYKLAEEIWPALLRDHGLCGIVGKRGGPIEGFGLLRIGTMWYSDVPILEEKAMFIHPDYRNAKGGRAKRLCQFSKRVADELGYPLIIGVLSNFRTAAKIRMYERQFGPPTGAFFLYGAQTGQWQDQTTEH
jgi:GNAT superfamily N-acetyltransferase